MPLPTHRPDELKWRIFRGSTALRRELLTPAQLRSRAWTRVRNDVYADARLERDHELACRAASLRLPPGAAVAGPSAAYLDGVRHAARPDDPVHVLIPTGDNFGPRHGLRVHQARLLDGDVEQRGGMLRTVPSRTAWTSPIGSMSAPPSPSWTGCWPPASRTGRPWRIFCAADAATGDGCGPTGFSRWLIRAQNHRGNHTCGYD